MLPGTGSKKENKGIATVGTLTSVYDTDRYIRFLKEVGYVPSPYPPQKKLPWVVGQVRFHLGWVGWWL